MSDGTRQTPRFNVGDIVEVNELGRDEPLRAMILDVCNPDNSEEFYLVILPNGNQVWYWEQELLSLEQE